MNEILEGCMVAIIFLSVCFLITWLLVPKGRQGLPSVDKAPPAPKCKPPKPWPEVPQNPLEPNPIPIQKTDQEQRFDVVFDYLKSLTIDTYTKWDELPIFLQRRHLDQIQIVCEELQELLPREEKPQTKGEEDA